MLDTIYKILDVMVMPLVLIFFGLYFGRYFKKKDLKEEKRSERQRGLELAVYTDRNKLYLDLIKLYNKISEGATPEKIAPKMQEFKDKLPLFASDEVVRGFTNRIMVKVGKHGENPIKHWGHFILDLRKDMGYPETNLSPAEILKCFIKEEDRSKLEKVFYDEK